MLACISYDADCHLGRLDRVPCLLMRDLAREDLFERWLTEVVRAAGPYDDYEKFSIFSERIKTVSDTVTGDAEALPASEKRDEAHGK